MAVVPYATDASAFAGGVSYAFRVQRVDALQPLTLHGTDLDVVCALAAGGATMSCRGPAGLSGSAALGDTGGGTGAMRVFAGLRSDPAFFDRQGALATIASGRASFTGTNAFAKANVLAIVVELPSAAFGAEGGPPPRLAVASGGGLPEADAQDGGLEAVTEKPEAPSPRGPGGGSAAASVRPAPSPSRAASCTRGRRSRRTSMSLLAASMLFACHPPNSDDGSTIQVTVSNPVEATVEAGVEAPAGSGSLRGRSTAQGIRW